VLYETRDLVLLARWLQLADWQAGRLGQKRRGSCSSCKDSAGMRCPLLPRST